MTIQEFKRHITRSRRLEKPYFYFTSFVFICFGLHFLYRYFYQTADSEFSIFGIGLLSLFFGILSIYLIPNRYKVLSFPIEGSVEKKKKIIADTIYDLDALFQDNPNEFWSFNYRRPRTTFECRVYLAFNDEAILATVLGKSGRGSFIDLGQTEHFRKKLATSIIEKIKKE